MNADEREFVFRLESLRQLRERERDECRQALVLAEQHEDTILRRQAELTQQQKAAAQQACDATQPGIVDLDRLIAARSYRQVLAAEHETLDEQRQELADEIDRRREATLAAERQTKVLEKLRDRQRLRHHELKDRLQARRFEETLASGGSESRWVGPIDSEITNDR